KGLHAAVEEIKKLSRPCSDSKAIAQVGTISANSDERIGNIIAEAMERVGKEGVITVEDRKSTRLNSSHVKISYAVFCLKKITVAALRVGGVQSPTRPGGYLHQLPPAGRAPDQLSAEVQRKI